MTYDAAELLLTAGERLHLEAARTLQTEAADQLHVLAAAAVVPIVGAAIGGCLMLVDGSGHYVRRRVGQAQKIGIRVIVAVIVDGYSCRALCCCRILMMRCAENV